MIVHLPSKGISYISKFNTSETAQHSTAQMFKKAEYTFKMVSEFEFVLCFSKRWVYPTRDRTVSFLE